MCREDVFAAVSLKSVFPAAALANAKLRHGAHAGNGRIAGVGLGPLTGLHRLGRFCEPQSKLNYTHRSPQLLN